MRVTASRFRPNRVDWLASSFGRWDPIPSTPCTGLRLPDLEYSEYPLRVRPGAETAARVDASLRRVKPTKVLRQMRCMHASVYASMRISTCCVRIPAYEPIRAYAGMCLRILLPIYLFINMSVSAFRWI